MKWRFTREHLERLAFSPPLFVAALAIGIPLGLFVHPVGEAAANVVEVFERILQMCVVPILLCVITLSMGRIAGHAQARPLLQRIAVAVPLAALGVAVCALCVGAVAVWPHLEPATLRSLGIAISSGARPLLIPIEAGIPTPPPDPPLYEFLLTVIPANVYQALAGSSVLQIIFFSVLFGLSLGFVPHTSKHTVFAVLEGVHHAFRMIVNTLLLAMPVILTLTLAADFARLDFAVVSDMAEFVLAAVAMLGVMTLVGVAVVTVRSGCPWWHAMHALRESLYVAFTTRDDFASLAPATQALRRLHYGDATEVVVPIAISLCRLGSIAYFAIVTVLVARIYVVPLDPAQWALIAALSVVAGVATAGVGEVVSLSLVGIVLGALGLPLDAVLILLLAVDALIDPFRVMTTVSLGIALATTFAEPTKHETLAADHHFHELQEVRRRRAEAVV